MNNAENGLCSVGDKILIGSIADPSNPHNSHAIPWRILAISGDNALVLSEYLLSVKPYHYQEGNLEWAFCSLRTWLNIDFFQSVFSPDEQEAVERTPLDEAVKDRVFLLSTEEFNQYLSSDSRRERSGIIRMPDRAAIPAPWFEEDSDSSVGNYWWLRSCAGYDRRFGGFAAHVDNSGYLGKTPFYCERWVRPAMWVKLNRFPADRIIR